MAINDYLGNSVNSPAELSRRAFIAKTAMAGAGGAVAYQTGLPGRLAKGLCDLLTPKNAWAGDKEDEIFKEALKNAKRGDRYWHKKRYKKAMPHLEKAVELFEELPEKKRTGNYGAVLSELAGCITHSTLDSYYKDGKKLPDSIERLKRSKELLEKAIDDLNYYASFGKKYKKEANKILDGTYNVLGITLKYLGDLKNARKSYENAITLNPNNDDAKFNLKHLNTDWDAFIRSI